MSRFEVPEDWEQIRLDEIAYIQTGISKSSNRELTDAITVPYLRVANVQDDYLDLSEMKNIDIERHRLERYALQPGDVLFTEGGDFDKLGRGTVWEGQIENCIHQNHVFAVRPDPTVINPYFLSSLASSSHGKRYFLTAAKQTTNLASINN